MRGFAWIDGIAWIARLDHPWVRAQWYMPSSVARALRERAA